MKHFWSITVKQHWCNLLNNWSTWRVVLKPKRKNTENGCIQVQRKPRHLHLLWCTFELLHPLQVGCVLMLLLCSYSKVCILRKGVNNIYSDFFLFFFFLLFTASLQLLQLLGRILQCLIFIFGWTVPKCWLYPLEKSCLFSSTCCGILTVLLTDFYS